MTFYCGIIVVHRFSFEEAFHSFLYYMIGQLRARDLLSGRWHAKGVHVDANTQSFMKEIEHNLSILLGQA